MSAREKPQTLYKFRSWSDRNHRKLLTESKLWVPVATALNDPFDCCIPFRWDLMLYDDLVERMVELRSGDSPSTSEASLTLEAKARIEELGIFDPDRKVEVLQGHFVRRYRTSHGVLSFATIRDDPLLWSHYADCYRGFCVGLDYDKFGLVLKNHFYDTSIPYQERWIHYAKQFPELIPSNDDAGEHDAYIQLFTTKSDYWSYEREYRYVYAGGFDFELECDESCLSEIILGSEMSSHDSVAIRAIVKDQFPSARLLQAQKKPLAFGLEFVPLD